MSNLPTDPGIYHLQFRSEEQRFTISIPLRVQAGEACPLIFTLHWGGPIYPFKGAEILTGMGIPAFEHFGPIIVAPDSPEADWANPTSEGFILDLFRWFHQHYDIQKDQTLLMGYSLGGIGVWYFTGRNQGRFRAAMPVSAKPVLGGETDQWETPTYVIHSRQDELFPFERVQAQVDHLQERGAPVELHHLDGATHFDTGKFIPSVRAAIPWLQRVWSVDPESHTKKNNSADLTMDRSNKDID